MFSLKTLFFMIACVNSMVFCMSTNKVLCSYDDEDCLTKATRAIYPKIVAGIPGKVEASDPLNRNEIDLDIPNLNCKLFDATLHGLLKCSVKDVQVNSQEAYFIYQIWCPDLQIEANFQVDGKFDDISVEGTGTNKIVYSNYEILLRGYYGKFVDPAGDLHTNITDFKLELSAEEVTSDFAGMSFHDKNGGKEVASAEGSTKLEKIMRTPMMYSFIRKYINNLNEYLKIVPVKDIHYQIKERK